MELKSFINVFGSVLNLVPQTRPSRIKIIITSDEDAIKSDWKVVGDDLKTAINLEGKNIKEITKYGSNQSIEENG